MKRRKYLGKVTITIISLVLIPILVLSLVIRGRAARELERSSRAYYEQLVQSFAGDFTERLSELQRHALAIALDSKTDKSVFHNGVAKAKEHPYWYYQAVNEMSEKYVHYHASRCGIYYYDLDRVVTIDGVWGTTYFMHSLSVWEKSHPAWDFFLEENYSSGNWVFSTTLQEGGTNPALLAGYCTELGKNRDRVMILYTIPQEGYAQVQSTVYNHTGIGFQVLDAAGEHLLMSLGAEQESEMLYCSTSAGIPLTFRISVTDSSLQSNETRFYRDFLVLLTILVVAMCLLCLGSIYLVYRPVRQLTSELVSAGADSELDEFERIRDALGERRARIQEQENLIMDLLLKHMIHGIPISERLIHKLGISADMVQYCVFVISGHVLPASAVERMAEQVQRDFKARLLVTDWQEENKSILILFQPSMELAPIEAVLQEGVQSYCGENCTLVQGNAVSRLDEIRRSFLSCLEKINAMEKQVRSLREEVNTLESAGKLELKEQVLNYLEQHFRDEDFSQVKVADEFQISTYTLSRLFKNQVGIGFAEYVNNKRLEYARTLLLTTALPIKEVAIQSGYTSESYFGRIFKATYGISPSVFKEQ